MNMTLSPTTIEAVRYPLLLPSLIVQLLLVLLVMALVGFVIVKRDRDILVKFLFAGALTGGIVIALINVFPHSFNKLFSSLWNWVGWT